MLGQGIVSHNLPLPSLKPAERVDLWNDHVDVMFATQMVMFGCYGGKNDGKGRKGYLQMPKEELDTKNCVWVGFIWM